MKLELMLTTVKELKSLCIKYTDNSRIEGLNLPGGKVLVLRRDRCRLVDPASPISWCCSALKGKLLDSWNVPSDWGLEDTE